MLWDIETAPLGSSPYCADGGPDDDYVQPADVLRQLQVTLMAPDLALYSEGGRCDVQ